jgi:CRP/FNR family cyclic AMP-dependent transcriptional regulator
MPRLPSPDISDELDNPSTFMPFKSGSGHYDPAVAKAFFKAFGRKEEIVPDTTIFLENEKSKKQSIFKKPALKALTTPIDKHLFAKRNIHRMFLLTEGEVVLSAKGKLVETVRPGDVFGEMAVIAEIPDLDVEARRTATALSTTQCTAYSLDGNEAQAGLAKQPEFALMLMSVMFERLRLLLAKLASVKADDDNHRSHRSRPIFDEAMLASLQEKLDDAPIVRYNAEAKIFKEGKAGTSMYVVLEGKVAVVSGKRIIDKLEPGSAFGEMALVDQTSRVATAVARTDCALLAINRDALIKLVKADPAFGMAMMRSVAERLRYLNSLFM